jgi:hypothetical protein
VQDATIAAAIGLLVAWAAVEGATAPPREESTRAGEAGFVAVLAVSIVAAGIDVAAARGEMRLPARAARFGLPYSQGFGEQEKAPGDVTARAFRGHASLVRPAATNRFELRGWVRSPDGEARVRIWTAGMLISIPDGGTFAQTIPVPPGGRSVWLDFHTSRGNVLVAGTFEGAIAP